MNRKIDELGRLVIPKEMRNKLGIKDNDPVNIECIENKIIITNPSEIDYKARIDKAIEFYNTYKQECVMGRTKEGKLIKKYYLPAHLSKKLIDIIKGEQIKL